PITPLPPLPRSPSAQRTSISSHELLHPLCTASRPRRSYLLSPFQDGRRHPAAHPRQGRRGRPLRFPALRLCGGLGRVGGAGRAVGAEALHPAEALCSARPAEAHVRLRGGGCTSCGASWRQASRGAGAYLLRGRVRGLHSHLLFTRRLSLRKRRLVFCGGCL
ncbi:expressed protein, partial [Baffinella frigidus]